MGATLCVGTMASVVMQAPVSAQETQHEIESVVVTGSRVTSNGFDSPTPLTVLGAEDIARTAPANISDFVDKLPEFATSPSPHNSSDDVSDGNAGVSYLNLRGLGPNRTLVLLDGVRVAPASISGFYHNGGAVDTNPFPDALIKRVDVATGGASAVYGSDAVAGAVNFILDKNFTGVKGEMQGGLTGYGDDGEYRFSLTAGTPFADGRGHLLISGSETHNDGILTNSTRNWRINPNLQQVTNPAYTATNGQPQFLIVPYAGSAQATPGGLITTGPLKGTDFGAGGVPSTFKYGSPNDGNIMSGGSYQETEIATGGAFGPGISLDDRMTRGNLFGRASYEITDNIEVYGQVIYSKTDTFGYGGADTSTGFAINATNPFIPASTLAQMKTLGLSSLTESANLSSTIGLVATDDSRVFQQYIAGADGDFHLLGTNWNWDAYVTRSTTQASITNDNNLIKPNFALATNAVTNPANGLPVCASTLTSPNNGCVPYNTFGTGVNTAAAINYISGEGHLRQTIAQNEISATLRGEPLSTWAGPVSMAFGIEHRNDSVTGDTTALDTASAFYVGNYKATHGSLNSTEGFFETLIPLAKDMSWAKELSLNGAVRETNYSTSGEVTTWKVGGTYKPVEDFLFRVSRSEDIRAPNLGELFSAGQAGTSTVLDDFKNKAAVPGTVTITVGNPDLQPEKATNTGVGAVYQPSWVPGLSTSFDYFNTYMTGTINSTNQQGIIDSCFAGVQAFCADIIRNAAGTITTIYAKPENTSYLWENGFNIEASYRKKVSDFVSGWDGVFSVRALATHVAHLTQQAANGQVVEGAGVNGSVYPSLAVPKWSYNVTVSYDTDAYDVSWSGRGFSNGVQNNSWIQCTSGCPTSTTNNLTYNNVQMPGEFYMDVNATYHLKPWNSANSDMFLAIDNVADVNPGNVAILGFQPGNYDLLGRVFRFGLRFKM